MPRSLLFTLGRENLEFDIFFFPFFTLGPTYGSYLHLKVEMLAH